ncbi:hypothetical protein [Actinoalloteichus hymeniacidonis]|nr:hypothetical protein [Actinoalloteichus hymeniacidonis]MBB5906236.1 hypothetical protein [Actinoalloteichus hymeniacidonis]
MARINDTRGREWLVRPARAGWKPWVRPTFAFTVFDDDESPRSGRRQARRQRQQQQRQERKPANVVSKVLFFIFLFPFLVLFAWICELIEGLLVLLRVLFWLLIMPFYLVERLLLVLTAPLFLAARHLGIVRWAVDAVHVATRNPGRPVVRGRFEKERFRLRGLQQRDEFVLVLSGWLAEGHGLPQGRFRDDLRQRFALV